MRMALLVIMIWFGFQIGTGTVVSINTTTEIVSVVDDKTGNLFEFYGDDFTENDRCWLIIANNGTPCDVTDDIVWYAVKANN